MVTENANESGGLDRRRGGMMQSWIVSQEVKPKKPSDATCTRKHCVSNFRCFDNPTLTRLDSWRNSRYGFTVLELPNPSAYPVVSFYYMSIAPPVFDFRCIFFAASREQEQTGETATPATRSTTLLDHKKGVALKSNGFFQLRRELPTWVTHFTSDLIRASQ